MSLIVKSVDGLIGDTPILELEKTKGNYKLNANVFAKLECFNPGGSIKDRVAKNMLDDAEKRGILNKDTVIIWQKFKKVLRKQKKFVQLQKIT